jgi:hypothetical protein
LADVASEIEALERQGWEALSGPDGATFYDEAMADDGLMLFPGMAMDKADSLSAMRTVAPWSWFELEDVRVIAVGPDGAVIT